MLIHPFKKHIMQVRMVGVRYKSAKKAVSDWHHFSMFEVRTPSHIIVQGSFLAQDLSQNRLPQPYWLCCASVFATVASCWDFTPALR